MNASTIAFIEKSEHYFDDFLHKTEQEVVAEPLNN